MDMKRYNEFLKKQHCIDCGTAYADKKTDEFWVTENQCDRCWKKHGTPESRGLPGAADEFNAYA